MTVNDRLILYKYNSISNIFVIWLNNTKPIMRGEWVMNKPKNKNQLMAWLKENKGAEFMFEWRQKGFDIHRGEKEIVSPKKYRKLVHVQSNAIAFTGDGISEGDKSWLHFDVEKGNDFSFSDDFWQLTERWEYKDGEGNTIRWTETTMRYFYKNY